jgi:hypothetical protein
MLNILSPKGNANQKYTKFHSQIGYHQENTKKNLTRILVATLGIYLKECRAAYKRDICISMFVVAAQKP